MSVEEINRFLEDDLDDEEQELQDNRQEYLDTNLYQAARDGRAEIIEGKLVLYYHNIFTMAILFTIFLGLLSKFTVIKEKLYHMI